MRSMVVVTIAAAALIACEAPRQAQNEAAGGVSEPTMSAPPKLPSEAQMGVSVYLITGHLKCESAAASARIEAMGGDIGSRQLDPSRDQQFREIVKSLQDFPAAQEKFKQFRSEERLCRKLGYDRVEGLAAAASALETEIELISTPHPGGL